MVSIITSSPLIVSTNPFSALSENISSLNNSIPDTLNSTQLPGENTNLAAFSIQTRPSQTSPMPTVPVPAVSNVSHQKLLPNVIGTPVDTTNGFTKPMARAHLDKSPQDTSSPQIHLLKTNCQMDLQLHSNSQLRFNNINSSMPELTNSIQNISPCSDLPSFSPQSHSTDITISFPTPLHNIHAPISGGRNSPLTTTISTTTPTLSTNEQLTTISTPICKPSSSVCHTTSSPHTPTSVVGGTGTTGTGSVFQHDHQRSEHCSNPSEPKLLGTSDIGGDETSHGQLLK
ncbi:uncharacterized protein LOC132620710 [Lycium barbarum]|uniref:uncharacterized protein LOC132620710 n=1 Tax=Lycium barbarum TaxID=112863 RepID=UPI00293ED8A6|nr:uncharacterized protein LOC132620710 [Lycium barbarum]